MPPPHRAPAPTLPRIVIYFQTQFQPSGQPLSILPIVTQSNISVTHVNVAAIHLNEEPGHITLNDHVPHHPRNHTLWAELRVLQACGIKVLGMLGGAARGSYARLDRSADEFEAHYVPLRDFIRARDLDGLDLDVEELMSLGGIIRLIDRLKSDFGEKFIITLAPVAPAMYDQSPTNNLSGFNYSALELERGHCIEWYNAQFYCGWGDVSQTDGYDNIIGAGWKPEKIVMGMITNPENGSGWVDLRFVQETLLTLKTRYPCFGGVMAWEYFNSLPGGEQRPWDWAVWMSRYARGWSPD